VQRPVDAVPHPHLVLERLDVDVGRPRFTASVSSPLISFTTGASSARSLRLDVLVRLLLNDFEVVRASMSLSSVCSWASDCW